MEGGFSASFFYVEYGPLLLEGMTKAGIMNNRYGYV
jgi:hypothetical protein